MTGQAFYVASSFRNKEAVHYVADQLKRLGLHQTYDWTIHADSRGTLSVEELKQIGEQEMQAVGEADFIVALLPGGKGTHVEIGMALALRKPLFLYSLDDAIDHVEATATFYHLSGVTKCFGSLEELVETIIGQHSRKTLCKEGDGV
ncbi:nucleoside 2-deoxyribosyltransferase [Pullulanibacillus sp. KACC 23026]|uniref:nucleoside 2-deoxyribosyltransferase n=1 Tax=Pullulanibacillus sp. KACC 23026 TaxID=3028315 RepID=UPI0023AF0CB0|nr:nucleoside 2-deoxyribosyltransferase [Pullulanibacillus sp. KACC 23026]WEG14427.1 nucleoside 2-deoxyribosyltransferase [Pullulanibacillus sp. KACC 23026]